MKKLTKLASCSLLAFLMLLPLEAFADRVVSVADGDTITVLDRNNKQTKIRLYGIDTPEKKQAYGQRAKSFTESLVAGKEVKVKTYDKDRYGRTIGVVTVDWINVNEALIEHGYAWQYGQYCKESFCNKWSRLESEARSAKKGLWQDPNPVAPWDWRRGKRVSSKSQKQTVATSYNSNSSNPYKPTVATTGSFHGNTKSHIYHSSSCRYYTCKNCTASFSSRAEAESNGYRACKQCD